MPEAAAKLNWQDYISTNESPRNGVELMVYMAKQGEIDPWNVDIDKVADEYLKPVSEMQATDLKGTGKTLLHLAILLRLKSDQLAGIDYLNPTSDSEFLDELNAPDLLEGGAMQPHLQVKSLEEVLQRRTSTKQPRIRTVTLNDLIRELQKYEELEQQRALREKVDNSRRYREGMMDYEDFTADDIEEMAHEEFIEDTIFKLKNVLERVFVNGETMSLTQIQKEGGIDKISAFLALLFLAARGEVDLQQEEFYTELYVTPDTSEDVADELIDEDDGSDEPDKKQA